MSTYFLQINFGASLGKGWDGDDQRTRSNIIDGIIAGEWKHVLRVIEMDEPTVPGCGGMWRDITEDIAKEVADRFFSDREPVPYEVQDFLQRVLGVTGTRGLNCAEAA